MNWTLQLLLVLKEIITIHCDVVIRVFRKNLLSLSVEGGLVSLGCVRNMWEPPLVRTSH